MKLKHSNIEVVKGLVTAMLLIVAIIPLQAQTLLDNAHAWTSTEQVDLYTDQTLEDDYEIYLSETLIRLTCNGINREFAVSNIQGNWTNLQQAGELTFNVQVLDLAGLASLKRANGELTLVIDLSERKDWMKRKFIINNPQ